MILFEIGRKSERVSELQQQMNQADFWSDQERSQRVLSEFKQLKAEVEPADALLQDVEELQVLHGLAEEEQDQSTREEVDQKLAELRKRLDQLELQQLLSGKHDPRDCFLTIYSGEGGTEANDWAEMLLRMYIRFAESQGWTVQEVDKHLGEETGITDATLHISGPYAYGYLSCERGTHRLARVSPFNAQGKRQTSFASVEVVPELEETTVTVAEKDVDVQFFARSSGPGGQNVNKVATACRMVHQPTGIMVVCSNERSQQQNRRQAMAILQGKLEQRAEEEREQQRMAELGGKLEMGWGTQIRSYVLYDNRVKDTRTAQEATNPERVLDGDLLDFIDAELRRRQKARAQAS